MLYLILKQIIRLATWIYFKKIHVKNGELVPNDCPIILVPNHPGSFMDPLVVAATIGHNLHFIAKGEMFGNPMIRWIFGNLHMIPIYRPSESPELMHKNKDVFKKAFDLMSRKGALIIFPEGQSKTERRLRKIKTGAARIALGAEAAHNFGLGIKIIPIGLNYSNPHRFQSELFVNISKPIDVAEFFDQYKADEYEGVNALTGTIRKELEDHIITIENEDLEELIQNIELIYKKELEKEAGMSPEEKDREFKVTKDIVDAVNHFYREDPMRVELLKQKIERYMSDLDKLQLKDHVLRSSENQNIFVDAMISIIKVVLGAPIWLYGAINNYLPYKIPEFFAKRSRPDFYGAMAMSFGIFTFTIFYSFQIWFAIDLMRGTPHALIVPLFYAISLPVTGMLALYYSRWFARNRRNWIFVSAFYRKSDLIAKLISQRANIVEELESGKIEYLENNE